MATVLIIFLRTNWPHLHCISAQGPWKRGAQADVASLAYAFIRLWSFKQCCKLMKDERLAGSMKRDLALSLR